MTVAFCLLFFGGLSLAGLKLIPFPYAFLSGFGGFFVVSLVWTLRLRSSRLKIVVGNFAVLALALGGVELVLLARFKMPERVEIISQSTKEYIIPDQKLGYRPMSNSRTEVRAIAPTGQVIYNTIYSIDNLGHRTYLPGTGSPKLKSKRLALFFGDSFTFGEGLADEQTIPNVFERAARPGLSALNLAFSGYGPNHMLAILENHLVEEAVQGAQPIEAIYLAIPAHVQRISGRLGADMIGPRYSHGATGKVQRLPADLTSRYFINKVFTKLSKWLLAREFIEGAAKLKANGSASDNALFVDVVTQAAKIFETRYHGRFHVLLWRDPGKNQWSWNVEPRLRAAGISSVTWIDRFIPDLMTFPEKYTLPFDGHPNAHADQRIGEYLALKLISPR